MNFFRCSIVVMQVSLWINVNDIAVSTSSSLSSLLWQVAAFTLTEIMLTCSRSLLIFMKCTSFFTSSLLWCLLHLLLLLFLHLLRWWLNSWLLINIFIFACFNKCWCMLNHHDQKIWCCCCVHHLSVVMIHMCCALIERACKCKHCFVEKHNYVMNLISRSLQLMMCHAAWMITQHLITYNWNHLTLHLRQWKNE